MRAPYSAARDREFLDAASVGVASALRSRDLNIVETNRFLAFEKYGPHGLDGKPGTEDDLMDPFQDRAIRLPQGHQEWLAAKAGELIEGDRYQDAGYAYLYSGDAVRALSAFKRAWSQPPIEEATRLDEVAALLGAVENAEQHWKAARMAPRSEEAIPFYLSLLSEACSKQQVISIQKRLLAAWLRVHGNTGESCRKLLEVALKRGHVSNRGWIVLATAQEAYQAGHKKVVPLLIDSLKDEPISPDVKRTLLLLSALSQFAEGEQEKARDGFLSWLKQYPGQKGEDKVRFLIGWSHIVSGDNEKALEWLELVVRNHPDSKYAQQANTFIDRLRSE